MAITKTRRVELRTDPATDDLITEAAGLLQVAKGSRRNKTGELVTAM